MKKNFKSRFFKFSAITLATASVISAISISLVNNNNVDSFSYQTVHNSQTAIAKSSKTGDDKLTSNTNCCKCTNVVPLNDLISSTDQIPAQNTVYDYDYNAYATITSSQKYSPASANSKQSLTLDHITKFNLVNSYNSSSSDSSKTSNNLDVAAGSVDWIVKTSDLVSCAKSENGGNQQQKDNNELSSLTIKSLLYSPGGNGAGKSLFVLTKGNNNKFYLFRIQWEDQTLSGQSEMKGGDYELVKVLNAPNNDAVTKDETISSQDYNFMVLESSSTHTMQIMNVPDITNNTNLKNSNNVTMKFVSLSQTDFSNPNSEPTNTKTITINSTALQDAFVNNKKYKPIITVRDGATVYLTYQVEQYDDSVKDKFLSIVKIDGVNTGNNSINVNDRKNCVTFKLNHQESSFLSTANNSNQLSGVNVVQNSTTSYDLFYTFKKNNAAQYRTNAQTKIASVSLNLSNAFSNENTNKNIDFYDYLYSDSELYSVQKLYKANEDTIEGYVLLDEQNRVVELDANKKNPKLLYNFNASTTKLGNIYSLVTRRTNQSWFAQMEDGTFGQFLGSTLIGQWDKLSSKENRELPASVSIKSNSEISPTVLYQEVMNGSQYTSSFENYMKSSTAYRDFLDVEFIDPRIGTNPEIIIEYPQASTFSKKESESVDSRVYSMELTFKQKLRKVGIDGSIITNDTKEVVIAKQTYTFNNAETNVTFAEKQEVGQDGTFNFEVPTYIKNKKPSQVTVDEVKKYLIQTTNITNPIITYIPHDQNGTMDISVTIPIAWIKEGQSYSKRENYTFFGTLGSDLVPFFRVDKYGIQGEVSVVDSNYDTSSSKYENLKLKYSDKVASTISKKDILDDFIIYGLAFNNNDNKDLEKASEDDITLTPNDKEGNILVDVVIPKMGSQENVRYVFTTPSFFLKNASANRPIYFTFKSNDQALSTTLKTDNVNREEKSQTIRDLKPSSVASILNGTDADTKVDTLSYFAEFSSFFNSYIRENNEVVTSTGDDNLGTLNISINLTKANIVGFDNNIVEITYSGFTGSNLTNEEVDNFSFGDSIAGAANMFATEVDVNQLEALKVLNYGDEKRSASKTKEKATVSLTPSRSSGTLEVSVTFKNYIESSNGKKDGTKIVYPTKTFTRIYDGFKTSKNPVNIIGFKSFNEISVNDGNNSAFSNSNTPSRAKDILTSRFMLDKDSPNKKDALLYFASVTNSLDIANSDISSVTLIADDIAGTLNVAFTIVDNGITKTISPPTPYSGFRNTSTAETTIAFKLDNSPEAAILKNKLPSEVNVNDISNLYTVSNNNNNNPIEIVLGPDDATGTLSVSITIEDPFSGKIATNDITYTGMRVFIPPNEGTKWEIVVLAVIIPAILLLIPILTLGYIQNIKDRRKIAKRLDKRLDEEFKKRKPIFK